MSKHAIEAGVTGFNESVHPDPVDFCKQESTAVKPSCPSVSEGSVGSACNSMTASSAHEKEVAMPQ